MTDRNDPLENQPDQRDKSQQHLPSGREPVHQGQQFDEMQRQHKNPDGETREENES